MYVLVSIICFIVIVIIPVEKFVTGIVKDRSFVHADFSSVICIYNHISIDIETVMIRYCSRFSFIDSCKGNVTVQINNISGIVYISVRAEPLNKSKILFLYCAGNGDFRTKIIHTRHIITVIKYISVSFINN